MKPVNKTVKDVIRGSSIQKTSIMLCLWYTTTYADLCKSGLLPHLHILFPICAALVLLPLCHRCTLCGTWQHRTVHNGDSKNTNQRANPETKPADTSCSELSMSYHFFEISVEPELGTEASKYSSCQFWTTACQHLLAALDAVQCWNCLHPVKRSPSDLVYSSSSLPSSLFLSGHTTPTYMK